MSTLRTSAPRSRPAPALVLVAFLAAGLTLIPLISVITSTAGVGWDAATRLIFRPRVGLLLRNTLLLALCTVVMSVLLGVAGAWIVERTRIPGARIWGALLTAPLAIPAFVTSYGWVSVLPGIDGLFGATLIMGLAYYPFVFLPVTAALRGIDPAWEEQARTLGLSRAAVFARVVLPQLRPAVLAGSLIVALHCLSEFGAFQMLRFATLTTAIYDQFRSTFASGAASVLAFVLVVCCLALVAGESVLAGRRRQSRVGGSTSRALTRADVGRWRIPAVGFLTLVAAAALGVPLTSIGYWLSRGADTWPDALSTTLTTLALGALAAVLTLLVAFPVGYLAIRFRSVPTTLLDRLSYVSSSVPGVVVALALITVTITVARPLYQTHLTLLIAYVVLFLPRALAGIKAGLRQASPELEEAARALGVGSMTMVRRVVLPLLAPSLSSGAALVFIAASTELTATLMLSPTGTTTLATRFWSHTGGIDYLGAAPYATMMVLISAPTVYLLTEHSRRVRGR